VTKILNTTLKCSLVKFLHWAASSSNWENFLVNQVKLRQVIKLEHFLFSIFTGLVQSKKHNKAVLSDASFSVLGWKRMFRSLTETSDHKTYFWYASTFMALWSSAHDVWLTINFCILRKCGIWTPYHMKQLPLHAQLPMCAATLLMHRGHPERNQD
jgi:hypothetical protein